VVNPAACLKVLLLRPVSSSTLSSKEAQHTDAAIPLPVSRHCATAPPYVWWVWRQILLLQPLKQTSCERRRLVVVTARQHLLARGVQVQRVLKLCHVAALVVTERGVGVHHTYRTTRHRLGSSAMSWKQGGSRSAAEHDHT
jgi:hypothetical protein